MGKRCGSPIKISCWTAIQPVSVIPVVCPYSQSVAWVRAEAKKMAPGASDASTAAFPSGKARMGTSGIPFSPRLRARSSNAAAVGVPVGVPVAAGVGSDGGPGVAVDEGVLECVATTEGCAVGFAVAMFVGATVVAGAA